MSGSESTAPAIEARGLTKTYDKGKVTAVNAVSFTVGRGELFGLIGPDGAGKTSIMRILTTLLLPDGGSGSVDGFDVVRDYQAIRGRVGYMPGKFSLYQDLTVEENLSFFATVFGTTIKENYHLVSDIYAQIAPFKDRKAGKLSGGMKQKLALSCALIHKPSVLFLDEPTTGVDAVSRKEFWEMLKRLRDDGISILVSTPYMDEATLCDRIALLQGGHILTLDTPERIVAAYPGRLFALRAGAMHRLMLDVRAFAGVGDSFAFGEWLHLSFRDNDESQAPLLQSYLADKGHTELDLHPVTPGIEDCFIHLMQHDAAGHPH
jgi:ABC-type multidrug transport system ATPase subunit